MHGSFILLTAALLCLTLSENISRSRRTGLSLRQCLLRPSQAILFYTFLLQFLGAAFFQFEFVLDQSSLYQAKNWRAETLVIYAVGASAGVLSSNRLNLSTSVRPQLVALEGLGGVWAMSGFTFIALGVLSGVDLLLLLGTSFFFASAGATGLKSPAFIVPLLSAVVMVLPAAAASKRVLIFPVLAGLLLAWRDRRIPTRSLLAAALLALATIIPLSIVRGYGSYEVEGFWDAVLVSTDYVSSPIFLPALGNNIEAASFYFHGINSLDAYLWSESNVWGETILNAAFLGSSAYNFDDGLRSSIEIYTSSYYPQFRNIGGSYPIAAFSELAMNFGVGVILGFPILLMALDSLNDLLVRRCRQSGVFAAEAAMLYATILLARGASFDLFLYNLAVLGLPVFLVVIPSSRSRLRRIASSKARRFDRNLVDA